MTKSYFNNRRILVTGAAGFIGSRVCEELVLRGAKVTAIVRDKKKAGNLSNIKQIIAIKALDLTDKKKISRIVKRHSIVIHAAAVDGGTLFKKRHADRIFHDNVHMTMNIFQSLKKSGVEKLIFVSTAEVYGSLSKKENVLEESFALFSPDRPEQWYAFSKVIGELSAELIGATLGVKVIIVRPANIYGPKDSASKKRLVPLLVDAVKKKKKKMILGGTGEDVRTFLYIDDYVHNLLSLIEKSNGGIYNIAGETAISIKSFVKIFSDASGLKVIFREEPQGKPKDKTHFTLNISKAKKTVRKWHDSPYEKRVHEILQQI